MRRGALEIETIARLEMVLLSLQRNLQFSLQDVQKFLALMVVRLTAAALGSDAEQMWFPDGVPPGEQFHAHSRAGLQHLALVRGHQPDIRFRGVKKIKNIGFVKTRQLA